MDGKTQQYKDFVALVNIPTIVEEQKSVRKYWLTVNALKIVTICVLLTDIISTVLDLDIKNFIHIITAVSLVVYIWYRSKSSKKFRNILFEDCDSVRALTRYSNLISYTKRQNNWELHFYNLASLLYYSGRIEDVVKVQSLLKKYCSNNLGQMYYEMIGAQLALYAMNTENLQRHCSNMCQLAKKVQLKGIMRVIYAERIQSPALMQMWHKGEYIELYDNIKRATSPNKTMLTEVKKNYYLYKVALVLGDDKKVNEHKMFIIQKGGSLWYRNEILQNN